MNAPLQAILFDMDGTIFDSESLHLKAWALASREFGLPAKPEDFLHFVGVREDACYRIFSEAQEEGFQLDKFIATKRQFVTELSELGVDYQPGFEQCMEWCLATGLPLGLVTSSTAKAVEFNFRHTPYANVWQHIITGADVDHPKPAPDCYLKACALLNVEPQHTLVLEDSNAGATAAIDSGCRTVVIPDYGKINHYVQENAWKVIKSLTELKPIFE